MLSIEIDGESYVRAGPGFSPVKGAKPHILEKTDILKNKVFEPTVESCPSLAGKCIAITGTTSGTGYWAAIAACTKGAKAVLLLNRESIRSKVADEEIINAGGSATAVHKVVCDLMSFDSCRSAAKEILALTEQYGGLDVLACNAGIMSMPDDRTEDGYDVQMQVNHLSHALLVNELMPALEKAAEARGEARIVTHSSGARFLALGKYPWGGKNFTKCDKNTLGGNSGGMAMMSFMGGNITRYGHSKLANTVYAMGLHDALKAAGSKVKAMACEPGLSATSLLKNGWQKNGGVPVSQNMVGQMIPMMKIAGQTGADGACPLIMASFSSEAESGDLYCPKGRFMLPPIGIIYTKGKPIKTISAGVPYKKGKEKRSVSAEYKLKCMEATAAAVGPVPIAGVSAKL